MKFKSLLAASLAVAASGAAIAAAPPKPAEFVAKAGASDLFEIESARAVVKSSNPKVSAFATEMIGAHAKSTAAVKAAAKADGLTPKAPVLTVKQRADLTALKVAPGKTKDDLYLKQQKAAHTDALALMQGYAADGTAPHLKAAAGKIAPVVEKHIAELNAM